jgi:hypothetical protein
VSYNPFYRDLADVNFTLSGHVVAIALGKLFFSVGLLFGVGNVWYSVGWGVIVSSLA